MYMPIDSMPMTKDVAMQIGQFVFGLAGLLGLVAFMPPLAGRLRLPYSVLLALIGFALGILLHLHAWAPKMV